MTKCNWCSREETYFELRQNEVTGKYDLWDSNLGLFHTCPQNTPKQREKDDYEARKEIIKHKTQLFKTPVHCSTCNKNYPPLEPCTHMIADGFITGKDTWKFYEDSKEARLKRNLIKKQMLIKNTPPPESPQQKLF